MFRSDCFGPYHTDLVRETLTIVPIGWTWYFSGERYTSVGICLCTAVPFLPSMRGDGDPSSKSGKHTKAATRKWSTREGMRDVKMISHLFLMLHGHSPKSAEAIATWILPNTRPRSRGGSPLPSDVNYGSCCK